MLVLQIKHVKMLKKEHDNLLIQDIDKNFKDSKEKSKYFAEKIQ